MILEEVKALNDHFAHLRHHIHRHPEPSGHECETAAFVAAELRTMPQWEVTEGVGGGYGVVAVMKGGKPGKTVALRADMDALQIQEETNLPFKSENDGVMHSCGHDIHTASVLGAARVLAAKQADIAGTIRLIFQPAEEMPLLHGSRNMIAAGALGDAVAVFGFHVWPGLPFGTVSCTAGPVMAASDHFTAIIHGKSSHAAKPDEGIDAVVVGAQAVSAIQSIVSRSVDPLKSAVVTTGRLQAGTRYNIVAESCELEGTVRTLDEGARSCVADRMETMLNSVCAAYGATVDLAYEKGNAVVVNHPEMSALAARSVEKLFGADAVRTKETPSMCAEDFSFYLQSIPGCFMWVGTTRSEDEVWPLHNCHYAADDDILWRAVSVLVQVALDTLEEA